MKKNNVAIIPARGGSQAIANKNIRDFAGKPLIAWTIETALTTKNIARVIVSTDSPEIAEIAKSYGAEVPFLRPKELADHNSSIEPVLGHAVSWLAENEGYHCDSVTLLFPTNPLRWPYQIEACLELFYNSDADMVLTVNESPAHYTPFWTMVENEQGQLSYFSGQNLEDGYTKRQDFPVTCYAKNDLVFVIKTQNLLKENPTIFGGRVKKIVTDRIYDGDINNEEDWQITLLSFNFLRGQNK